MIIDIDFSLDLEGFAEKIVDHDVDEVFNDGIKAASYQARGEIETNFEEGGRPTWPLTQDGRTPLMRTGRLAAACSKDAVVEPIEDGFELSAAPDQDLVASVQDRRYGIFVLPDEAQEAVANALEEGMLGD